MSRTAMVHQPVCHTWRLREADDENLGLAFTDDYLLIGRTVLIEKHDGQFIVRQQHDIERLLSRAYRTEIRADRLMSGLATVARALNANDQCLAHIAAVHLRVPDIPDRAARDAMETMDVFIKYGRDEGGSDSNWNPALHPRAGIPPNPGWFAPTGGGASEASPLRTAQSGDSTRRSDAPSRTNDDWIHLPRGPKRIDELTDFIEWIANAKAEDAPAIRAVIDRYFTNVGWESAAHDLKNMLAVLIRSGITNEDRRKYLNRLDLYTRVDPAEYVRIFSIVAGIAAGIGRAPRVAGEHSTTGEETSQIDAFPGTDVAEVAPADVPSKVWTYGWARRGREIHDRFSDGSLDPHFPVIDDFPPSGVAISYKSIDLNAVTYQNGLRLEYRLNKYFDAVSEFDGATYAGNVVAPDKIALRVLHLIIPKESMTEAQRIVIEAAQLRASKLQNPVDLIITPY